MIAKSDHFKHCKLASYLLSN